VEFSVTDTGIGVSEDNLETIFGAFQQGDGTTSRRYGGTGLGLAICRELAAQLGGRVTAASRPGRGSTFTLYLPVTYRGTDAAAPPVPGDKEDASALPSGAHSESPPEPRPEAQSDSLAAPDVRPVSAADNHAALRGKKVLIVDDDLRNAFAITSILELYGLTIVHASDGRQGIEMLEAAGDIDIVLLDVMMPELDGHATVGAIREIPGLADLPVIAVTAHAMQGDRDKSLAAGASDYVTKPVDTEELLSCMERWLGSASAS
jgi:CheY-like chemotaxis protein